MEDGLRNIGTLWIGDQLNYLHQLALISHRDMGYQVTVYSPEEVQNLPTGIINRPASEIWDIPMDLVGATKASFLSNVFRTKMIAKTGAIWVDCDAYCLRPFPETMPDIFGYHGFGQELNCGVMALGEESPLLAALMNYFDNTPEAPPFFNAAQRKNLERLAHLPHWERIFRTSRTAFGPQAFTYFAKATGEITKALPRDWLYPVPYQLNDIFYDPHGDVEGHFTQNTVSVHLYSNGTKPWWENHPPLNGSFMAKLCEKHDLDPNDALGAPRR